MSLLLLFELNIIILFSTYDIIVDGRVCAIIAFVNSAHIFRRTEQRRNSSSLSLLFIQVVGAGDDDDDDVDRDDDNAELLLLFLLIFFTIFSINPLVSFERFKAFSFAVFP